MTHAEQPSIQLAGVRIFASRDGDHVTGRVEFPAPARSPHKPVAIDYRSRRPSSNGDSLSTRARARLAAVLALNALIAKDPSRSMTRHAAQAARVTGEFSARSLQSWYGRFEVGGAAALEDSYTPHPKRVLELDPKVAGHAVLVCAWWFFRIDPHDPRQASIDNAMVTTAAKPLLAGLPAADIIAAIDCYYAWPCDRRRYQFKEFRDWIRFKLRIWLTRACDGNDYRRGLQAERNAAGEAPLQASATRRPSEVKEPRQRVRDTLNRRTREEIRALAPTMSVPVRSVNRQSPIADRQSSTPSAFTIPHSPGPLARIAAPIKRRAATKAVAGSLSGNHDPQTVLEAIGTLDDGYRRMLFDAAGGDTKRFREAAATLPMWWDSMPQTARHNIDFRVQGLCRSNPRMTDSRKAAAAVTMLLDELRRDRKGPAALAVAARIC